MRRPKRPNGVNYLDWGDAGNTLACRLRHSGNGCQDQISCLAWIGANLAPEDLLPVYVTAYLVPERQTKSNNIALVVFTQDRLCSTWLYDLTSPTAREGYQQILLKSKCICPGRGTQRSSSITCPLCALSGKLHDAAWGIIVDRAN